MHPNFQNLLLIAAKRWCAAENALSSTVLELQYKVNINTYKCSQRHLLAAIGNNLLKVPITYSYSLSLKRDSTKSYEREVEPLKQLIHQI